MNRLNTLAFLVVLLSIMTYGIIEWRSTAIDESATIDNQLTPNFIAEALQSNTYNPSGQLSHVIKADRMEHYDSLNVTNFEQPNYTIYPKTGSTLNKVASDEKNQAAPWQLSANEATLYKNNRVILNHRVRLKATDKDSLIQEIHCKYLELDLNTNIISSEQTVMVQGKDFTMYGSGLIIDLNTKQMTLTEHVRTIYKKNNG